MLRELQITNFALIDKARLEFGSGLNLLTGETGAGKSILIDALGLALGERSSGADQVRSGAERAIMDALFDLSDAPESVHRKLEDYGAQNDDDPQALTVSREVSLGGKSVCRVNGRIVPVAALRDIAADLIDVHGQHEHQSLLSPDKHLLLFDEWLGADATAKRALIAAEYAALARLRREHETLQLESRERARNLDIYDFQLQEIRDAALTESEESELDAARLRLANGEKLLSSTDEAYSALNDSAIDALNSALAIIDRASALDPDLESIKSSLIEAASFADDARRELRRYRDQLEFNPAKLEEVEDRLSTIHSLKRKYGESIADVLAYADDIQQKADRLRDHETLEAEIVDRIAESEKRLIALCAELSKIRKKSIQPFVKLITSHLVDLGMAAARFEVRSDEVAPTPRGTDDFEFMISANPGEPVRPLAKVASGGELSRIMLAMKSVLSQAAFVPTLIFDEIDVGVGGRTAAVIADKLRSLSASAQVMCITHLPQIASRPATAHFAIEKHTQAGRTMVSVRRLSEDTRVDEIIRMLGGNRASETVLKHAQELLTAT